MAETSGRPAGDQPVDQSVWLPVAAAARRLRVTQQAIRRRLERGTIESRRAVFGNRSRLEVRVDSVVAQPAGHPPEATAAPAEVAELRERLAAAEAALAEVRATVEAQREHIADLRAELERRRWPGLVPWLRRALWGEGREG